MVASLQFATLKQNMGYYRANILKENKLALGSVIKDCLITDTLNRNVGFYSDNMLKESVLVLDSVVKNFFITAEKTSVVHKEGKMQVYKESLPTASTIAKFATVQRECNVHFLHIGASLKDLGKKLFAFSKLGISPEVILNVISKTEIS